MITGSTRADPSLLFVMSTALIQVLLKATFQTEVLDMNGNPEHFVKPLLSVALMFLAMAIAPLMLGCSDEEIWGHDFTQNALAKRKAVIGRAAAPAMFRLVDVVLFRCSLRYLPVSTARIAGRIRILIAALLAVTWQNQRLSRQQCVGVATCGLAAAVVALSVIGSHHDTETSNLIAGLALVIAAQLALQANFIISQKMLQSKDLATAVSPAALASYIGACGFVGAAGVVLPVAQLLPGDDCGGVYENTMDSIYVICFGREWSVLVLLIATGAATVVQAVSLNRMLHQLGAMGALLRGAYSDFLVWVGVVSLHYGLSSVYGEPLTASSAGQLLGWLLFLLGDMIYGGLLCVPGGQAESRHWDEMFPDRPKSRDLTDSAETMQVLRMADAILAHHGMLDELKRRYLTPSAAVEPDILLRCALSSADAKSRLQKVTRHSSIHLICIFPMFAEHNRILSKSTHEHGQDFLRHKVWQLQWLFSGTEARAGTWELVAVDDGCLHCSKNYACAIVDEEGWQDIVTILDLETAVTEDIASRRTAD